MQSGFLQSWKKTLDFWLEQQKSPVVKWPKSNVFKRNVLTSSRLLSARCKGVEDLVECRDWSACKNQRPASTSYNDVTDVSYLPVQGTVQLQHYWSCPRLSPVVEQCLTHKASCDDAGLSQVVMFPTILAGSHTAVLSFCKTSLGYPKLMGCSREWLKSAKIYELDHCETSMVSSFSKRSDGLIELVAVFKTSKKWFREVKATSPINNALLVVSHLVSRPMEVLLPVRWTSPSYLPVTSLAVLGSFTLREAIAWNSSAFTIANGAL